MGDDQETLTDSGLGANSATSVSNSNEVGSTIIKLKRPQGNCVFKDYCFIELETSISPIKISNISMTLNNQSQNVSSSDTSSAISPKMEGSIEEPMKTNPSNDLNSSNNNNANNNGSGTPGRTLNSSMASPVMPPSSQGQSLNPTSFVPGANIQPSTSPFPSNNNVQRTTSGMNVGSGNNPGGQQSHGMSPVLPAKLPISSNPLAYNPVIFPNPQSHGSTSSHAVNHSSSQILPQDALTNSGLPSIQPMPANLAAHLQQQQQQRMELQDAFQYLDRVKSEFADQPDVYSKFLQIMREFKANTIDANGVIFRVVNLFKGHSNLIQGFNAFLPKTHHIDPSVAETGILPPHILAAVGIPQSAIVAAAMGSGSGVQQPSAHQPSSTVVPPSSVTTPGIYQSWNGVDHQQKMPLPSQQTQTMNFSSTATIHQQQQQQQQAQQSSYSQNPSNVYYSQGYGMQQSSQATPPQRVANLPPIQPFVRGQPPAAAANTAGGIGPIQQAPTSSLSGVGGVVGAGGINNQPSMTASSNLPNTNPQFNRAIGYVKKIKHRFSNEPEIYKAFLGALHSYHKEQKSIHEVYDQVAQLFKDNQDLLEEFLQFLPEQDASSLLKNNITSNLSSSRVGGIGMGIGGVDRNKRQISTRAMKRIKQQQHQTSSYHQQLSSHGHHQKTAEESDFFDQVKKHLGDRHVYSEFLKVLNLFSQDIIKLPDLVNLVHGFIGGVPELFDWFKKYVGYKDGLLLELEAPLVPNIYSELNLETCTSRGSYRILPKDYKLPEASGRTILCEEVLNDKMVSCPSFNSEDSTFIGSKKNQYEESLFRCEDERFEMDLLIEQNMATIAILEPIARKIDMMSDEEKNTFTLDNRLGGSSAIIYYKSIKNIYGDKAGEIMNGLSNNPATAVPIVLKRLKQKNEEWRKIQRDWNKIWREIHLKNYYKSLDHLGIEFRANDKKNFNVKYLISEIEAKAAETSRKQVHLEYNLHCHQPSLPSSSSPPSSNNDAFNTFYDLFDLLKLSAKQNIASANDVKNVNKFLDGFTRDLFCIEGKRSTAAATTTATNEDGHVSLTLSASSSSSSCSSHSSNSDSEPMRATMTGTRGKGSKKKSLSMRSKGIPRILYTNNNVFALIRLIVITIERLEKMKENSKSMDGKSYFQEKTNIISSFLDLQTKQTCPELSNDFYNSLIYLLKQLVVGQLDSEIFEERVRFMFGTAAYPIFTFDKLLQAIIRQVQVIINDNAAQNTINLFQHWLQQRSEIRLSEYAALIASEYYVDAKENLFRIEYNPKTGHLSFQLLERFFEAIASGNGNNNNNNNNGSNAQGGGGKCSIADSQWISYVDEFVKLQIDDSLIDKNNTKVFLRRCIRRSSKDRENISLMDNRLVLLYNLECKISLNSYKLIFVEGTEDFIYWKENVRKRSKSSLTPQTLGRSSFHKFRRWWQKSWSTGLSNRHAEEATKRTDRWFKQGI